MRHYIVLFGPFARENQKIQTIREIRDALDCGLVAAKKLVEDAWDEIAAYTISAEQLGNLCANSPTSKVLKYGFTVSRQALSKFKSVTPYIDFR